VQVEQGLLLLVIAVGHLYLALYQPQAVVVEQKMELVSTAGVVVVLEQMMTQSLTEVLAFREKVVLVVILPIMVVAEAVVKAVQEYIGLTLSTEMAEPDMMRQDSVLPQILDM
jgi:hypothetical protein